MVSPPVTLIDAHQHWWNVSQFDLEWLSGFPQLGRSFGPLDYAEQLAPVADRVHIQHALWMECDVVASQQVGEAQWAKETGSGTNLAGLVAAARPEHEGFSAHLDALEAIGGVRGVRRVLFSQPDELSESPLFRRNIQRLADKNWTFDICMSAGQLPLAAGLVRACPEVNFVLDHCGNPDVSAGTGEAFEHWRENLQLVSREPNVVVKVSGIVASAPPEWDAAMLRPFIETTVETFGATRSLWSSDWPVCLLRAGLADWVATMLDITRSWSETDQHAVFEGTARRVYKI